ncbi:hypothetical protein MtrunA17_Chr4g0019671 [Medicago truncatula]|uniref:Uncharacterized protein n=1 Tax=Medicago truncatula TaxID=3880 RepID=A0A396I5B8_MEDTR|nr:hypothetical protein MtrunA17_Chr4g0019671 [Medicago truncatula]
MHSLSCETLSVPISVSILRSPRRSPPLSPSITLITTAIVENIEVLADAQFGEFVDTLYFIVHRWNLIHGICSISNTSNFRIYISLITLVDNLVASVVATLFQEVTMGSTETARTLLL